MYQDERKLDFKPLGIAIKKAREAKGWTTGRPYATLYYVYREQGAAPKA